MRFPQKLIVFGIGGPVLLLVLVGIFVKSELGPWHGGVFTATKRVIGRNLRDVPSAQWRNLAKVQIGSGDEVAVCGKVNAKNALGGYTGFVPFFSVWRREGDTGRHSVGRVWVRSEAATFQAERRRWT
jgi:hypothetical protein